ncbi:hypothetical protein [Rhodococcus koreensis]
MCDNAAASPHGGVPHSGIITISWFGLSRRVFWPVTGAVYTPSAQGAHVVGQRIPPSFSAAPAVLLPQGLNKAADQLISQNTWTKPSGWNPRSGFPDTNEINDEMVMTGAGNVSVFVNMVFTGGTSFFGAEHGFRVLKNDVVVPSGTVTVSNTSASNSGTVPTFAVALADRVRIEAWQAGSGSSARTIDTATYFTATVV